MDVTTSRECALKLPSSDSCLYVVNTRKFKDKDSQKEGMELEVVNELCGFTDIFRIQVIFGMY